MNGERGTLETGLAEMEDWTKVRSLDELIQEIAETLAEADGRFIVKIANQVLTKKYKYIGDSMAEEVSS